MTGFIIQKVEVEISPEAVVHCPAKRFTLRKAAACVKCNFFHGVIQIAENADTWRDKYRIGCEHVIFRKTETIGED